MFNKESIRYYKNQKIKKKNLMIKRNFNGKNQQYLLNLSLFQNLKCFKIRMIKNNHLFNNLIRRIQLNNGIQEQARHFQIKFNISLNDYILCF